MVYTSEKTFLNIFGRLTNLLNERESEIRDFLFFYLTGVSS